MKRTVGLLALAAVLMLPALAGAQTPIGAATIRVTVPEPARVQTNDDGTVTRFPMDTSAGNIYIRIYEAKDGGAWKLRDAAPWAPLLRFKLTSINTRPFCWRATVAVDNDGDKLPDEESAPGPTAAGVCAHYTFPVAATCTAPQPPALTQPGKCPAGTQGAWTQTSVFTVAPYPSCWLATPFAPATPPDGSCKPFPLGSPGELAVELP